MLVFLCHLRRSPTTSSFFFFNDTATTEIYTLSLHDALPISGEFSSRGFRVDRRSYRSRQQDRLALGRLKFGSGSRTLDRKSTRLNSSHLVISYAVFCLKKKNTVFLCMPIVVYRRGHHCHLVH